MVLGLLSIPISFRGGAGIGSGCSSPYGGPDAIVESRAENIVISGGTVLAKGGANCPGIGSGTVADGECFYGTSVATGIRLTGGEVEAIGGKTYACELGFPAKPGGIESVEAIGDATQVRAIGAGFAASRLVEDVLVAPSSGFKVNAWKGASPDDALQFLVDETATTDLTAAEDPYVRAEFTALPSVEPISPAPGGDSLARTGDGLALPMGFAFGALALAVLGALCAIAALAVRRRHR